jgi:hypothetical protein
LNNVRLLIICNLFIYINSFSILRLGTWALLWFFNQTIVKQIMNLSYWVNEHLLIMFSKNFRWPNCVVSQILKSLLTIKYFLYDLTLANLTFQVAKLYGLFLKKLIVCSEHSVETLLRLLVQSPHIPEVQLTASDLLSSQR